jgi:hypothetical protein
MPDQTPLEKNVAPSSVGLAHRALALAIVVVMAAAIAVVVSVGKSSPTFTSNPAAYCAAGKAWSNASLDLAAPVTKVRVVEYLSKAAAAAGHLAEAAPDQRVSDGFASLQKALIAEMNDPRSVADIKEAETSDGRTKPDAIARRATNSELTAGTDAAKSAAAECSKNSQFSQTMSVYAKAQAQRNLLAHLTPNQKVAVELATEVYQSLSADPSLTITPQEIVKDMEVTPPIASIKVDGVDVRFTFNSGPAVCVSMPSAKGPAPGAVTCP